MINGAHAIISSTNADADRMFLRDVLGLPHVDVGDGWLIFGLPPSEVAVHPTDSEGGTHELYLMCADVEDFRSGLSDHGIESEPVADRGWGLVTQVTLPGGGKIGVYEPRHARPESASSAGGGAAGGAGGRKRKSGRGAGPAKARGGAKKKAAKKAPAKAAAKAPKAKKGAKKKAGKRGRA